jgi:hypothetical protein
MSKFASKYLCMAIAPLLMIACGNDSNADDECLGICSTPGCGECPELSQVTIDDQFAIDSSRVSRHDYELFQSTNVPFQRSEYCTQEFANWRAPLRSVSMDQDEPITFVTWCQAEAYCKWTGRRLCGRRGGGPLTVQDVESATREDHDEWYAACVSGNSDIEDLPPTSSSEYLNGTAEEDGALGTIVASYPGCSGWTTLDWETSGNLLGFRCCADL